ncbi:hypothetical protein FB565_007109 [Actinoplanes lutulentus]|nr:hypothetical protein [Actinoplanes lutulentus]MBB2947341.1 hypothetical protein [Actinoplanes lutulentus]
MEPIGDPDETAGDFAEEHESTEVEQDNGDGDTEVQGRQADGSDPDGPP